MRRRTITNEKLLQEMTTEEVKNKFIRHCVVKNLSKETVRYYQENFNYFGSMLPTTYISEITITSIEDFIFKEKEKEKKIVTINSELRAIRALLYFAMERGYIGNYNISLLKDDHMQKELYTNAELAKLLKKPTSFFYCNIKNTKRGIE